MRDVLPPLPPPPVLNPRPGDWTALRRRAARRQRARYAAGGAIASFAVAAAVLVTGPTGGPASLRLDEPAGRPTAGETVTAGPAYQPLPSAPATAPQPGAAGVGASSPVRGVPGPTGGSGTPAPPAAPGRPGVPQPPPSVAPPAAEAPGYVRTDVAYTSATEPCDYPGFEWALWCFRQLRDPYTARPGETHDYAFEVCRLPGSGAGTMSFATTQEFSFGVAGDEQAWSWERGRQFAQPGPKVTVGDGRCARWTVTWSTVDDAGRPLEPGRYTGSVSIGATYSDSVSTSSVSRGFQLDVVA